MEDRQPTPRKNVEALDAELVSCVERFPDRVHARRNAEAIASSLAACPGVGALLSAILKRAESAPDPCGVLNNFERLFAAFDDPCAVGARISGEARSLELLAALFGYSQFLSDVLFRYPQFLEGLLAPGIIEEQKAPSAFRAEAAAILGEHAERNARRNALCRWRKREMLRIGLRDILRMASVEDVTREISDLAQACIGAAAQVAWEDTVARYGEPVSDSALQPGNPCGMCVLGMGKLGGRELNFSSDIDLVFIYEAEGNTTGELPDGRKIPPQTNHVFFNRMGENIVNFLSTRGEEGNMFRVDMRLRPEGKSGPLSRSLESFINYLREQAREWERIAYLKARVLTGPSHLAERIYRFAQEFVFSASDPGLIVREIEKLKLMIDREVADGDIYHREVKRGYGGIREIEFVISAMQIIYGHTHRALRARNIFVAIERLQEVNLLSAAEAEVYLRCYELLRLIEHRLQMAEEHQTHTIPHDENQLHLLARRCHFAGVEEFRDGYQATADAVHERFMRFFQQDVDAASREARDMLTILDRQAPADEALAALSNYGIGEPGALYLIHDLAYGTREIFIAAEGQRFFEQMLPSLLRLISRAPAPARVLPHLHSFMLAIKGITYYNELIAQHPEILKLLVWLFGTSDQFSEALIAHPEYFDALISSRILYEQAEEPELRRRIGDMLRAGRRIDRRLVLFRRAVKFELLLVALRRILNMKPQRETLAEISRIADVCMDVAMGMAAERTAERFASAESGDTPAPNAGSVLEEARRRFAVIAMGKYGGCEPNFFSDLDVVYVYDDRQEAGAGAGILSSLERAVTLADSLSSVLMDQMQEGRVFSVDARLRPHGKNSPLVTPLSLFVSYLEGEAQTWEFLALTRARHVWGNGAITAKLLDCAKRRWERIPQSQLREDAVAMRGRLEESVLNHESAPIEFKRAAGGVVDIEFLLQYLQITRGTDDAPTAACYFDALDALRPVGALGEKDVAVLRTDYAFFRSLETAVRLVTGASGSSLPQDEAACVAVARFASGGTIQDLESSLRDRKARVRAVFNRVLAPSA
jgi:glutamate-ammonia-ligase adenylyltransferase